jgi:hypothetical protein
LNRAGFIGVRGSTLYSASLGYGWVTPVSEFERGFASASPVSLFEDGAWGLVGPAGARTFQVPVNPGVYTLTGYFGDARYARDEIHIQAEGGVDTVVPNTGPNQFVAVTFTAMDTNGDGILDVTVSDYGGDLF